MASVAVLKTDGSERDGDRYFSLLPQLLKQKRQIMEIKPKIKRVKRSLRAVKYTFRTLIEKLKEIYRNHLREIMIAESLETVEGRERLAQAMVEPIREARLRG